MFRDPRKQAAYQSARAAHDRLAKEGSGPGMAYRKGWNGEPYDRSWTSWPEYAAGRDNRKAAGPDAENLPPSSDLRPRPVRRDIINE